MIKPALQDDRFLADVAEPFASQSEFRLWWLGQSGYLLKWNDGHLLFDPYLSDSLTFKYAGTDKPHIRISERVVAPQKLHPIDVVTSSHTHTDHLDAETLRGLIAANPSVEILAPAANRLLVAERSGRSVDRLHCIDEGTADEIAGFDIEGVQAAHPTVEYNEEKFCRYLGYVVTFGSWTIYHSGDTVVYDGMVKNLRRFSIDVAILPINGKVGNMGGRDAARLAKEIGVRLVIPCHYDLFEFNTADPYAEFVPECEKIGQPYRVLKLGERWSSSELPPKT